MLPVEIILKVVRTIFKSLRPWLVEQAKKTETPVDDYMIELLDWVLKE